MIIRSQNKAFIINFGQVDTVCLGGIEWKSVITFTDAQVVTLGEYSTEEKAIKVLDMIQNAYCRMKSCDVSMCGIAVAISKQSDDIANKFIEESRNIHVFQMPQDSEV